MKLRIISVGHRMPDWIEAGYQDYARRMPTDAALEMIEIKPGKRAAGASTSRIQQIEAERIGSALPPHAFVVALDERGKLLTTNELSVHLSRWMQDAAQPCFVIGGADGLDASIKNRADLILSLSRLTLPHALARVVLAEQLYRAHTILKGHPYHRD